MPPRFKKPAAGESADAGSPVVAPPTEVFHMFERPYFKPLGIVKGDKLLCIGGWQRERLRGARLDFEAHVWNLNVGRQYLRCWWPRGSQHVHLTPDQVRRP